VKLPQALDAVSLLPALNNQHELKELALSITGADHFDLLENVLQKRNLSVFCLSSSFMKRDLCVPIARAFGEGHNMAALRVFNISNVEIPDQKSFGSILLSARRLCIADFTLESIELSDGNVNYLCAALSHWRNLQSLKLVDLRLSMNCSDSNLLNGHSKVVNTSSLLPFCKSLCGMFPVKPCLKDRSLRLQLILTAASQCRKLEKLVLNKMGIEDSLISDLGDSVLKLKKLKVLSLNPNCLTPNGVRHMAKRLKEKNRKIGWLSVGGIEAVEGDKLAEYLQEICAFLN
jgi:hypothetical protein